MIIIILEGRRRVIGPLNDKKQAKEHLKKEGYKMISDICWAGTRPFHAIRAHIVEMEKP